MGEDKEGHMQLRQMLGEHLGEEDELHSVEAEIAHIREFLKDQDSVDACQDARIKLLELENAELKMFLAALIRVLLSKEVIDREGFRAMVRAVDALDGKVDGGFHGSLGPTGAVSP